MDSIHDILASPIFWWIILILLAITKEKRNAVIREVTEFAKQTVEENAGKTLVQQSGKLYSYTEEYDLVENEKLESAIQIIVNGIARIARSVDEAISLHAKNLADAIGTQNERPWKILGYLLQLLLLVAFFVADIIQTLNSLAIYYPDEIAKLSYVLDRLPLPIAIVMASVGTALALGIIISDFAGVTNFGDWNELKGWYRIFIQTLTYVTLVIAVSIAVVINLSKVVSIPDIAATLSVDFIEGIKFWAGIAQNVVIFPLYSTTFLFFGGLKGFEVIYLFLVYLVNFLVKVLHGIVWVITVLVMKGGTKGVEIVIKILLLAIAFILVLVGSSFIGGGAIVAFLFTLVQKLLEFVFYPADILFDKLWNVIDAKKNTLSVE